MSLHLRLRRSLKGFVLAIAVLMVIGMPIIWSMHRPADAPFGIHANPDRPEYEIQDFAFHLNILHQIWNESVPHPYRLADQERMIRLWFPDLAGSIPHAYSPVALALGLPLLAVPPAWAYFGITLLNAVLLLLLTWYYLLPRARNGVQAAALLATFLGFYLLYLIFYMGQSALITTCLLASGFMLLQKRPQQTRGDRFVGDLLLGCILYLSAAKPSFTPLLAIMILAEGAWLPLLVAGVSLAIIWLFLGNLYGGYISGLQDYENLLSHYRQSDMTPFFASVWATDKFTNFASALAALIPGSNALSFLFGRILFEGLFLGLFAARLCRLISPTNLFQGLLWTFLLFCPYLLATEDIAICLLIVEGNFFRPDPGAAWKVILVLFLVGPFARGLVFPLFFFIKLVLALWWLVDLMQVHYSRKTGP